MSIVILLVVVVVNVLITYLIIKYAVKNGIYESGLIEAIDRLSRTIATQYSQQYGAQQYGSQYVQPSTQQQPYYPGQFPTQSGQTPNQYPA